VVTSAIVESPENPMTHANLMVQSAIEREFWAIEFNIVGIGISDLVCSCDLDLDPITFIYELIDPDV